MVYQKFRSHFKEVLLWFITILVVGLFLMSGLAKLAGMDPLPANYEKWGYPDWFLYVIGAIEVASALVLIIPRFASLAALSLGGVMVGAFVTHLFFGEWSGLGVPAVLFGLLVIIGNARKDPVLEMFGERKWSPVRRDE